MASVTFLGACGTVTGSATLLEWKGERVLVDCGLFQGPEETERLNWMPFPFEPSKLSAVVLTHAHLDHCGRLPVLARAGFRGPIYCSRPSRALVSLVLLDAAKLQEEEARFAAREGYSRHRDPKPLFDTSDVKEVLRHMHRLRFDEPHELLPGIRVTYRRAGHLLGAASVEISAKGSDGRRRTWGFSGDVGRYGAPILQDPRPLEDELSGLVLESTYGNRHHPPTDAVGSFRKLVEETFGRGGTLMIPAFALGRTQEVLYHLATLADEGVLDPGDVFLDSPMAIKATELYARAEAEHDDEMIELVERDLNPLRPDRFQFCRSVAQSKELNARTRPAVIVAGSGMVNGGRILHHLARRLDDPKHTLCLAGYQAAGTRGRALAEGAEVVVIHGREIPVRARVVQLDMLSAHADREELLRWGRALPHRPERVFLNHGEDPARKALEAAVVHELGWARPALPLLGDRVDW